MSILQLTVFLLARSSGEKLEISQGCSHAVQATHGSSERRESPAEQGLVCGARAIEGSMLSEAQKNATHAQDAGSQQLRTELARLRMEKANVDRQLAEEKAKQTNAQANVTALQAQIVSFFVRRSHPQF